MKKSVLVLIGALLVSNALWGAVFFVTRGTFERSPAERFQVYTMSGTGEQWDVTNYTVVASSEKISRGPGHLVYKGNPDNLTDSTYYKYEVLEWNARNEQEVVWSTEAKANGGPVAILLNTKLGTLDSPYPYGESIQDLNKSRFEHSVIQITWDDKEGNMHTEIIALEMMNEVVIGKGA